MTCSCAFRCLSASKMRVLELDPAFTITPLIAWGGQARAKLFIEGLRKAGLPE